MAHLVLDNVTKVFRGQDGREVSAVRDLSLAVGDREFMVIVGPSGCGKTTTLRLIAGLEEPTRGQVVIAGRPVNGLAARHRDLAMIFQHGALYPHLTARENIALGLRLRGAPAAETARRVAAIAETLDLTALLDRHPRALSGGERQRVAIGRALARQAQAFLFDEPFSHLDAQFRAQLRQELHRLRAQLPTAVFVTHDQAEAMALGDRVAVMRDGVLQQVDEPLRVYREPANVFVAGFLGSPPMNLFRGITKPAGLVMLFQGAQGIEIRLPADVSRALADRTGAAVILGIRAEAIGLATDGCAGASTNRVSARVEAVEPLGAVTHLHLVSGGTRFVACGPASSPPAAGSTVVVRFDPAGARCFDPVTGVALG